MTKSRPKDISVSKMFRPKTCPDISEIPETYTYPVKIMTVTQRVRSTIQIEVPYVVARGAVDVGGWTSESDDEMSVGEFCAEK